MSKGKIAAKISKLFQCSSASRKFLNPADRRSPTPHASSVSVLFSEPKIPQSKTIWRGQIERIGFSALQRAENSSILAPARRTRRAERVSVLFSEPKIPQSHREYDIKERLVSFSALQRAENSSIPDNPRLDPADIALFQCSSASRKFLNRQQRRRRDDAPEFQCSSASRKFLNLSHCPVRNRLRRAVSVLFSEPKIPQYKETIHVS